MENFSAWLATDGWTWLFVVASFGVYLYIGLRSRVDETKDFYIAGQGIPAICERSCDCRRLDERRFGSCRWQA